MSVEGVADMSVSGETAPSGNRRAWIEIKWPHCWSRRMEFWNWRALVGVAMMVDLAPWVAKSLAVSIMGIWWPPPTKGKKSISTLGAALESMMQRETDRQRENLNCEAVRT